MDVSLLGINTIIRLHRTDSDNFRNFHKYLTEMKVVCGVLEDCQGMRWFVGVRLVHLYL